MILAIDIGNTSVGLCGIEINPENKYTVKFSCKMGTFPEKTEDEYMLDLNRQLEQAGVGRNDFEAVVISSVVPDLEELLGNCVSNLLELEAYVISAESNTGLRFQVEQPEKIGKDRLADAVWASETVPLPAVTVDLGTATTFNVIDKNSFFLGGIICAGVATGLSALRTRTAQLPEIHPETPEHLIGKTTKECMLSGAVIGTAAMIDGMVSRISAELGKPVSLILTGGFGNQVSPFCKYPHINDPFLLYKGMVKIYEHSVLGK